MSMTLRAEDYARICAESSERAGIIVRPATGEPLDLLMAWREEVLRDVFELSPEDDLTDVMAANRARYEKDLANGTLILCFAWPAIEPDERDDVAESPSSLIELVGSPTGALGNSIDTTSQSAALAGNLAQSVGDPTGLPAKAAEPVATGALCLQEELPSPDNPRGTCGYLMNIYTRPAWRRRGVARAVVAWLCAEARARDLGKVYLEATPAAKPLYHSLGFTDMVDYLHL